MFCNLKACVTLCMVQFSVLPSPWAHPLSVYFPPPGLLDKSKSLPLGSMMDKKYRAFLFKVDLTILDFCRIQNHWVIFSRMYKTLISHNINIIVPLNIGLRDYSSLALHTVRRHRLDREKAVRENIFNLPLSSPPGKTPPKGISHPRVRGGGVVAGDSRGGGMVTRTK